MNFFISLLKAHLDHQKTNFCGPDQSYFLFSRDGYTIICWYRFVRSSLDATNDKSLWKYSLQKRYTKVYEKIVKNLILVSGK